MGDQLGTASIAFPDASIVPYGFVLDSSSLNITAFSNVLDTLLWTSPEGTAIGITTFTADLLPVGMHEVGTGFSMAGQAVLPLSNAEAAVAIAGWQYGSMSDQYIRLMRMDLNGNVLDDDFVAECGYCGATIPSKRAGDGLLMAAYQTSLSNSYSGGDVVYLDASGSVLATYGTPSVDDTLETFHTIISAFIARILPNGRLVLAGATRPGADASYQSVVQVADSTLSQVFAQFFPAHEHNMDHPGVARCLDLDANGDMFFGQTENVSLQITIPEPGWPSNVHLYKFDNDLNVTGSYVIDGFSDSSYYFLRSVRATADGGALLTGSIADVHMNTTDLRTKAWVARVSAEDLVSGMEELATDQGNVFPNPGSESFRVELVRPVRNGILHLFDMSGRVICSQPFNDLGQTVHTPALSPGCYHLTVIDGDGRLRFQEMWMTH